MRFPKTVDLECRNCFTLHTVEIEYDEAGGHAEMECTPCHDDECKRSLCGACPQFTCACCGLTFCMEHLGREEDPECTCVQTDVDQFDARSCEAHGTRYPRSVLLCRVCAAPEEVETRVEPVTEYGQITDAA
jgi:hypothetical protein